MKIIKNSFLILLFAFCTSIAITKGADAPSRQDLFYYGDARILNLSSGATATQRIVMKKTLDPQAGILTEIACFQEEGKPPRISPVYMRVTGSSVTISDTLSADQPDKLTGTGVLHGRDWDWNFLEFSMNIYGVKVEDVNFVVKNQLIARKRIFLPNGTPFQLWETEMTATAPEDYQKRYTEMGCKEEEGR